MSITFIGYNGCACKVGAVSDYTRRIRALEARLSRAKQKPKLDLKKHPEVTVEYGSKWGPVFDVPLAWLLTIAHLESSHNPRKINMAAHRKGGAWGLMQQMADEAPYKVKLIRKFYGRPGPRISARDAAKVRRTVRKWRGDPKNLLNPDLNMMLAAWQLGRMRRIFKDFPTVIAAYHQGEAAVKRRLQKGRPAISPRLQPKGYAYVQRAIAARDGYRPLLVSMART